jgi:DNA polymerase I
MALYGGIELPGRPDLDNVRKLDLLPMPAIMEMMRYGMAIDREWLGALSEQLKAEARELRREVCNYIPANKLDEFIELSGIDQDDPDAMPMNVDSPTQLGKLLFKVLGVGKGQRLKKTASGDQISTGKKQLEKVKHEHPVIQPALQYRERMKLDNTYASKLPKLARWHPEGPCACGLVHIGESWRVHTWISGTRTSTGRYASSKPNLQNIPARTKLGQRVRQGFVASPGMELVAVDYSQQEMRLGAHYSEDANLVRIFQEGLDPHNDTARRAFNLPDGVEPDKLTQRDPCKNVNFAAFYEISASGLYDLMAVTWAGTGLAMPEWLTVGWCQAFIDQWFNELYPGVGAYLENQHYRARRYGAVWTLFGRIRRVPEVQSCHPRIVSSGLRQAGNAPIQGTGSDWMKLAIVETQDEIIKSLRREGVIAYPVLTVHDELMVEVEEGYGEMVKDEMVRLMSMVMTDRTTGENLCKVPVKADGKVLRRWTK